MVKRQSEIDIMSVGDILAVVTILISVGNDIHERIEVMKQADDDLLLLTVHLKVLSRIFEASEKDVTLAYSSEFVRMLGILKSIQESYNKCAKLLGVEPAGVASATQKTARNGKSITRRVVLFARIPTIFAEIRDKAEQLQRITGILSVSLLSDVRSHQRESPGNAIANTTTTTTTLSNDVLDPHLRTGFTGIDRMVEHLMKECQNLERQLRDVTLFPDASAVQDYQAQNPEGASFWKDRFQKGQLYASALRYEVINFA